jgi:23S rRNA (adenine-N6)-dimethyltransferase
VSGQRARRARPARAPSQHFLRTRALAAELVADAGISAADLVLDIGAGSGRLTGELAVTARRVVAIELDQRLTARLRGRWPNVDVVEADVLEVELPSEPFRVVANLPFDGTTEIMRMLLGDPRVPLIRADLVVEWEVARKRACPWPSTLNGVLWSAWYAFSVLRRLPASAFDPPPAVAAGVLAAERRARPLVDEAAWRDFGRFVATGFRRGLGAVARRRVLRQLRVLGAQPRELDAYQWAALFTLSERAGTERWSGSRAARRGAGA